MSVSQSSGRATSSSTVTVAESRRVRWLLLPVLLIVGLIAGLIAGGAWISNDDAARAALFLTPTPPPTPTEVLDVPYARVSARQPAGHVFLQLQQVDEWLILNDLRPTADLLSYLQFLRENLTLANVFVQFNDDAFQSVVDSVRQNTVALLDSDGVDLCYYVRPDLRDSREVVIVLSLPAAHGIDFPAGSRFVAPEQLQRFVRLRHYEGMCPPRPRPEKR